MLLILGDKNLLLGKLNIRKTELNVKKSDHQPMLSFRTNILSSPFPLWVTPAKVPLRINMKVNDCGPKCAQFKEMEWRGLYVTNPLHLA
jgi:hypothetical protein